MAEHDPHDSHGHSVAAWTCVTPRSWTQSVPESAAVPEKIEYELGPCHPQSRALATVLIAGFRGFLLDLFATHDRARIDRAVDLWLSMLYAE